MKFKEFSFVSYPITNVSRAFYEGVLGLVPVSTWIAELKPGETDPSSAFIEYEIGPDTLTIGKGAPNFTPGKTGATVALEVDGDGKDMFDAALAELREKNVKFLMETYDGPVCTMVLIEDPDGNQIMIHRRKKA